jgi:hypothetical protein
VCVYAWSIDFQSMYTYPAADWSNEEDTDDLFVFLHNEVFALSLLVILRLLKRVACQWCRPTALDPDYHLLAGECLF